MENKQLVAAAVIVLILLVAWLLSWKVQWLSPNKIYKLSSIYKHLLGVGHNHHDLGSLEQLDDPLGLKLLNEVRDQELVNMLFGSEHVYLVVDEGLATDVLERSPVDFGPVDHGCADVAPLAVVNCRKHWKNSRVINDVALSQMHEDICEKLYPLIFEFCSRSAVRCAEFQDFALIITTNVVLGERYNTARARKIIMDFIKGADSAFGVPEDVREKYENLIDDAIGTPCDGSLVGMAPENVGVIADQVFFWLVSIRNLIGCIVPAVLILMETYPSFKREVMKDLNWQSVHNTLHFGCLEAIRLFALAKPIFRKAECDTQVGKWQIKKGTQVLFENMFL